MRPPVFYVFPPPARVTAGETGERGTACYNRREMIDDGPGYVGWEEFHNPENEGLKLLEIWCVLVDRGCFWSSCWGDISRCRLSGGC